LRRAKIEPSVEERGEGGEVSIRTTVEGERTASPAEADGADAKHDVHPLELDHGCQGRRHDELNSQ